MPDTWIRAELPDEHRDVPRPTIDNAEPSQNATERPDRDPPPRNLTAAIGCVDSGSAVESAARGLAVELMLQPGRSEGSVSACRARSCTAVNWLLECRRP
jgi:hypothetical protein